MATPRVHIALHQHMSCNLSHGLLEYVEWWRAQASWALRTSLSCGVGVAWVWRGRGRRFPLKGEKDVMDLFEWGPFNSLTALFEPHIAL